MVYDIIMALAPGLITGVVLAIFGERMKKESVERAELDKRKRKEAKLNLDLTFAAAQLSYAVAMAMKRGHPNGEVEAGIKAYDAALTSYRKFEREQMADMFE